MQIPRPLLQIQEDCRPRGLREHRPALSGGGESAKTPSPATQCGPVSEPGGAGLAGRGAGAGPGVRSWATLQGARRSGRQGGKAGKREGGLGERQAQWALRSQPHRAWGTKDTC